MKSLSSHQDNITLEKLNLQGNWMTGDGGAAMARMLEDNDYITELVSDLLHIFKTSYICKGKLSPKVLFV